ncbi:helix-turn-helix transcriptional regulator [Adlercreutzia equolifaciens]|uniref:response regulator transcription factor n=1 Tax=Adlercreutzia equolifaciens TaxID=446660 RepID=UPI0023AF8959|nr:helix-turn-helix transcriptional regulator [Adlercreutzia equolifaciens]MDE8702856.1 helix-turn-helix transcriptional regulator [Adlercreutzia equolifaciens]
MGKLLNMMRRGRDDRSLYLAGIVPYLFALGCARAWVTLVVAAPAHGYSVPFDAHDLFDYAFCVASLAVALFARRLLPLNGSPRLPLASLGAMTAASLCYVGTLFAPQHAVGLMSVGAVLGGAGFGLFLLLWAEVLSALSLIRIFLYTTASQLMGVVFAFFCGGLDDLRMAFAVVCLPFGALMCIRMAYRALPAADRPARVCPKFSYPWKIFALLALYSFAYGLRQSSLAEGAGMHSSLSTAIIMAVLFASAYFFSNRFNIGALYRSPLVLVVCGFLLVPAEGVFGATVSSYLISMSYSLVSLIVALLLYDISKRLGVTVVVFAGIKGAEQVFVVWGKGVTDALGTAGMGQGIQDVLVAVAVVAMVLAATLILLSEKELASKWGVVILDAGGLVEKTPDEERREARVEELAARHHLTPRETEILALVAQGKNGPAIRQDLFIAEGTFKAHMSHIYEKCGVANRKELVALLGA